MYKFSSDFSYLIWLFEETEIFFPENEIRSCFSNILNNCADFIDIFRKDRNVCAQKLHDYMLVDRFESLKGIEV